MTEKEVLELKYPVGYFGGFEYVSDVPAIGAWYVIGTQTYNYYQTCYNEAGFEVISREIDIWERFL